MLKLKNGGYSASMKAVFFSLFKEVFVYGFEVQGLKNYFYEEQF